MFFVQLQYLQMSGPQVLQPRLACFTLWNPVGKGFESLCARKQNGAQNR